MNNNIEPKLITKTAISIGYTITFVSDNEANVIWSLNDQHGNSVDAGNDYFTGTTVGDIQQKLFIKLDIIPISNETTN